MKPPITWYGGKARLADKIIGWFPEHRTYCEPFGGSGAVLLAKPSASVEIYNDLNGDLVNLFTVLREKHLFERLEFGLGHTLYGRGEFDLAQQTAEDPVERARRFIVRHRQSHGGMGRSWSYCIADASGGVSSAIRRWQSGLDGLPTVHERLKQVQIEHDDWEAVIARFDRARTLFYLDPPYIPATRTQIGMYGGYRHEMTETQHQTLVARLLVLKGMAVLSGYAHETYRPLEQAGWRRIDYPVRAYTSDARRARIESLWLSPNIRAARTAIEATPVQGVA